MTVAGRAHGWPSVGFGVRVSWVAGGGGGGGSGLSVRVWMARGGVNGWRRQGEGWEHMNTIHGIADPADEAAGVSSSSLADRAADFVDRLSTTATRCVNVLPIMTYGVHPSATHKASWLITEKNLISIHLSVRSVGPVGQVGQGRFNDQVAMGWQVWQWTVDRPATVVVASGVRQDRQGWPPRP